MRTKKDRQQKWLTKLYINDHYVCTVAGMMRAFMTGSDWLFRYKECLSSKPVEKIIL